MYTECPYFYNMLKFNKYVQMNNEMMFANMRRSCNKNISRGEIKNEMKQASEVPLDDNNIHLVS
ncbi:hypothetical protein, partial [Clostridium sp.]|uniref:hypothetical protein n=1 Tax=Clostridium sp. TaxID=1506 RepID=UPI001A552F08